MLCCQDCLCATGCTSPEALQQCSVYPRVTSALKMYFRFSTFCPGQLEASLPALHGRNTFVRLPTGGGKSLCMFLVVLSSEPHAISSPLIGLLDEQVRIN